MFQNKEANLVSNTCRVSDNLGILQSNVIRYFHDIIKNIWSYQIRPHATNILQNPSI